MVCDDYLINLIDNPRHMGLSFEVVRSLAARNGIVLFWTFEKTPNNYCSKQNGFKNCQCQKSTKLDEISIYLDENGMVNV
uniref:Glycosyltransferase n=1 Tax=Strongyloides venezuelensis TaxID=75913 RepID=A0A0K0F390_STRVS